MATRLPAEYAEDGGEAWKDEREKIVLKRQEETDDGKASPFALC